MAGKSEADALFDAAEDSADAIFDAAPTTQPIADPGSPLERALKEQPGDVVTVQTPTGPAQFTRGGQRFYGKDEAREMLDRQEPRFREDMLSKGLSLLAGGGPMIDEAKGALTAASTPSLLRNIREGSSPLDTYSRVREDTIKTVDQADERGPEASILGRKFKVLPVVGAALPAMAGGAPATLLSRLGLGAAVGSGQGFFGSRASLAKGEVADVVNDTVLGGGAGLAGAGVAEVPGAVMRGGASMMRRGAEQQAVADFLKSTQQAASARGVAGSAGGAVQRGIEYVDAVLANPSGFSPDEVLLAQRLSSDPAVQEARRRVAVNAMQQLRSNMSWQQQSAQEAGELMSTIPQRAAAATDEALASPYANALLPRAQRAGTRAALGAAGVAVADATGGAVAAAPGSVQMVLNMMRDPRLKFAVGRDVSRVAAPFSQPAVNASLSQSINERPAPLRPSRDEDEQDAIQAFLSGG
jgi:hypothetical protein